MEEIGYWLALLRAPGIGAISFAEILSRTPHLPQLFSQPPPPSSLPKGLANYLKSPDWQGVERDLEWAAAAGRSIVLLTDPRYPTLLKDLPGPPPLLFVQGEAGLLATPQLAIVGSRNPTHVGAQTAQDFARHLASLGVTISSGLALGIDSAAHQGALDGNGSTVAVAGTGLDRVYPAANIKLAHAIVDGGGALVSEYPPGTPPHPGHFPRRNRIISGLSLGTLVVEAALRSGSLITARLAGEQGREVFAIPGSIHNPLARGCNRLIKEGAKLVERADDILEELAPYLREALKQPQGEPQAVREGEGPVEELDSDYSLLLGFLGDEPTTVDTLVDRSGLTAAVVSSMLLQLELNGVVTTTSMGYMRSALRQYET